MQGNFFFHNPTKLFFGAEAMNYLLGELKNFGPVVMFSYGGGSIKRNGIYDAVIAALKEAGKTVVEDSGVMPNPTYEKVLEGCKKVRDNHVDLILAVGGGSTIDYAKAVSASAYCKEEPPTGLVLKPKVKTLLLPEFKNDNLSLGILTLCSGGFF